MSKLLIRLTTDVNPAGTCDVVTVVKAESWIVGLPLIVMLIAFTLLFVALQLAGMRNEIMRRRLRTMLMLQAAGRA